MTALMGWLPPALSLLAIQFALANGASDWPDIIFDVVFVSLYVLLVGAGSYIYVTWFKAS